MYVQAPARAMRECDMVLTTNTTACPETDTCSRRTSLDLHSIDIWGPFTAPDQISYPQPEGGVGNQHTDEQRLTWL